jgi:hypothetical protein
MSKEGEADAHQTDSNLSCDHKQVHRIRKKHDGDAT